MREREQDIWLVRNGGWRAKYRSREDVILSAESVEAAVVMISGASGVREWPQGVQD